MHHFLSLERSELAGGAGSGASLSGLSVTVRVGSVLTSCRTCLTLFIKPLKKERKPHLRGQRQGLYCPAARCTASGITLLSGCPGLSLSFCELKEDRVCVCKGRYTKQVSLDPPITLPCESRSRPIKPQMSFAVTSVAKSRSQLEVCVFVH
ncbi:hypothetical protein DNTS_001697 [Danionella cerebrum]|uniref:Uncharacterized protein n=1 Tax=Danionella cerebrum TaxID=2873325 RepID=A0A553QJ68_9TELE|nr:hypothetical protein DNTS_001697 [Danionella translucida]